MYATNSLFNTLIATCIADDARKRVFYSGLVKSANTVNTIMNSFIVFGVIVFQQLAIGFSLSFHGDFGTANLREINKNGVPNLLFMLFQMMFTIITGPFIRRVRFSVLVVFFLIFWSTFAYDIQRILGGMAGGILLLISWLRFNSRNIGKVGEIAVNVFVVTIIWACRHHVKVRICGRGCAFFWGGDLSHQI